jgi:hypothetical protein
MKRLSGGRFCSFLGSGWRGSGNGEWGPLFVFGALSIEEMDVSPVLFFMSKLRGGARFRFMLY